MNLTTEMRNLLTEAGLEPMDIDLVKDWDPKKPEDQKLIHEYTDLLPHVIGKLRAALDGTPIDATEVAKWAKHLLGVMGPDCHKYAASACAACTVQND